MVKIRQCLLEKWLVLTLQDFPSNPSTDPLSESFRATHCAHFRIWQDTAYSLNVLIQKIQQINCIFARWNFWIFNHKWSMEKDYTKDTTVKFNLALLVASQLVPPLGQRWQTDRNPTMSVPTISNVGPTVANRQQANSDHSAMTNIGPTLS